MARRAEHTSEELKSLAIAKGLAIVDEKGMAGLTARSLAQAMGYTPGTLYHFFGSLDGYLLALSAHILDVWHAELSAQIKASRRPAIHTLAAAYIDFALTRRSRWELAFARSYPADMPLPESYLGNMARMLQLIDQSLVVYEAKADKRHRLAKTLWASMHGICALAHTQRLSYSPGDTPEALANVLLDLVEQKKNI